MREEPGPLGPTAWNVSGSLTRQHFSNHLKKACEKKFSAPCTQGSLMAPEQSRGRGGVGRRILAEERPGEVFLLGCATSRSPSAGSF